MKLSRKQKLAILVLIIVRITSPFLILKYPLWGILSCFGIDWLDFGYYLIFNIRVDRHEKFYHKIDKFLDHYYFTFIFIYFLNNTNNIILYTASLLFFYRITGYLMYIQTDKRKYFFIFQNFFENYAVITLLLERFSIIINLKTTIISLIISIMLKVPQEAYLHFNKKGYKDRDIVFKCVNSIRGIFHLAPLTSSSN